MTPAPREALSETQTVSYTVQFERKLPNNPQALKAFGEQVCASIRKDHGCYIAEIIDSSVIT